MNMLTGQEIKSLRKALRWSATKLGHFLGGLSAATVHYWEANHSHPRWDTMEKLDQLRKDFEAGKIKPEENGGGKPNPRKKELQKA